MYYVNIPEFKAEMVRKNYNITSLSKKMGVSRPTITRVLKGENPTYLFMCKSIDALNISKERAADIFFTSELT